MGKLADRISALEAKLKAAKEQKNALDQRKAAAEKKRAREADTRRKILVGAMLLARVDSGKLAEDKLIAMMKDFLTKPQDLELFGLTPETTDKADSAPTAEVNLDTPKSDVVSGV